MQAWPTPFLTVANCLLLHLLRATISCSVVLLGVSANDSDVCIESGRFAGLLEDGESTAKSNFAITLTGHVFKECVIRLSGWPIHSSAVPERSSPLLFVNKAETAKIADAR
ncbi:unnamed protein product [Schistocephalus solidus]|uniref:Secreted protein n=1 Tax=Schistocephalus solidus TaxID=70667 RepID=A0A183SFX6_SCHSO|nr:unnamed protein product [Schistocephalus solidus]